MLSTKHSIVEKHEMHDVNVSAELKPCLDSLSSKVVSSLDDVQAYAFESSFSNMLEKKIYNSEIRRSNENF